MRTKLLHFCLKNLRIVICIYHIFGHKKFVVKKILECGKNVMKISDNIFFFVSLLAKASFFPLVKLKLQKIQWRMSIKKNIDDILHTKVTPSRILNLNCRWILLNIGQFWPYWYRRDALRKDLSRESDPNQRSTYKENA